MWALAERSLGKSLKGKYRLERVLGIGGMAVVYRALHRNGKRVAIKMLLPECAHDPEIVQRFIREGYAANAVEHDGVVRVDDDDITEDGRVFVVMEHLDGATLEQVRVERGGTLPQTMALALGYQLLDVLVAAHAKGIIHRDIKPANLFLTRNSELKVLDFGIARFRDGVTPRTMTHVGMGTPDYAAPEQLFGRQDLVDARADLYATGATLYHLLTGATPRCESASARPLRELLPDAVPSLVLLIERALQDRRDDRWPDAVAMRKALLSAYHDVKPVPVAAGPKLLEHMRSVSQAPAPRSRLESVHIVIPEAAPPPADLAQSLVQSLVKEEAKLEAKLEIPLSPVVPQDSLDASGVGANVLAAAEGGVPSAFDFELVTFGQDEEAALDALMRRIEKKGDFPAFSKNVSEVSRQALVSSKASAADLAEVVLKDHSVTTKLLRHVNSAFYRRFGGTVSTISQAIVILGFDQVRTAAMSLTLFGKTHSSIKAAELANSSVAALICGEIAREVAPSAGLRDTEEAFVAAMFRHLGKHLLLFYLPELHDRILVHVNQDRMSEEMAARKVLGLSYEKVAMGVAKRWGFSQRVMAGMAEAPVQIGASQKDTEKLLHLSCFASEAFVVISSTPETEQAEAFERLSKRYQKAIPLSPKGIVALVETATKSFKESYQALLGVNPKRSSSLQSIERWAQRVAPAEQQARAALPRKPEPMAASFDAMAVVLAGRLGLIAATATQRRNSQEILRMALDTLRLGLPFTRALYFIPDKERRLLLPRVASGDSAQRLLSELQVPLAKGAKDPFSSAFFNAAPVFLGDVNRPGEELEVPSWFAQQVGARGLYVQPVVHNGEVIGLLYGDADQPLAPLGEKERAFLDKLGTTLAAALARKSTAR
jgi:serine/threonine protein kinase